MSESARVHMGFGLRMRSELDLPELTATTGAEPVDVEIVYGQVPAELPGTLKRGVRFQAAADALRLQVDGVATYLVEQGRRITIDRAAQADDEDVRVFLLGSAIGALLHQRGDLVLHASAIEWDGEAVVFLGRSGVGKSTLATAFRQRGRAVLTDDLCVVRPGAGGRMFAEPGFPQAKLWLDSLRQLEISPDGLRRIRNKLEKRAVPLGTEFATAPRPIRKLFVLRPHNKPDLSIEPVLGPAKFAVLKNQTYRFGFLAAVEGKTGHFQHALRLAQQAGLAAVERPDRSEFKLPELVAAIEADLRA